MALGNKRTPRKFIKGRTDNLLDSSKESAASASMANDVISQDSAYVDGNFAPILYHADLMQEDIDELRRHITEDRTVTDNNFTTAEKSKLAGIEAGADVTDTTNVVNSLTAGTNITIAANGTISSTASGGGGGGLTESPLAFVSGRFQWSSADDGERIHIGNTSYGPFNWYSHTSEPSYSTLRTFSKSTTVNTTTATVYEMHHAAYGIYVPNENKKVKARVTFRVQSAPNSSTFGFSMWDATPPTDGQTATSTITLRANSSSTTVNTDSTKTYVEEFTTTNTVSNKTLFFLAENRTGALSTNTYMYFSVQFFLVN